VSVKHGPYYVLVIALVIAPVNLMVIAPVNLMVIAPAVGVGIKTPDR
jgi:hypothetical protein